MRDPTFTFAVLSCLSSLLLILFVPSEVNSSSNEWRLAAHNRQIDIDICIRCDSPIPGPPGPPGPPGDTRQTIVKLEDNETGHAAGWKPNGVQDEFFISMPIKLEKGMSFEFTFINPLESPEQSGFVRAGNCVPKAIDPNANTLTISCAVDTAPQEGATLTYIITI